MAYNHLILDISKEEQDVLFSNKTDDNILLLLRSNIKLVYYCLRHYVHIDSYLTEDIAEQCGIIGLWKAIKAYDTDKGIKFSTFAIRCIMNEIRMECYYIRDAYDKYSLDKEIDFNSDTTFMDLSNRTNVDEREHIEQKILVEDSMSKLKEKESDIIRMYFFDDMDTTMIAKYYGCSRQNIDQIEKRALNKLKNYINTGGCYYAI